MEFVSAYSALQLADLIVNQQRQRKTGRF